MGGFFMVPYVFIIPMNPSRCSGPPAASIGAIRRFRTLLVRQPNTKKTTRWVAFFMVPVVGLELTT